MTYAFRDRFYFNTVLEFRSDTMPDQIRYLLVEIRSLLYAHPMVNSADANVRFIGFGTSSLRIEIISYINVVSNDTFLEIREDLLLRIMDIVTESGTSMTFPSQTLYFATDKGIADENAQRTAEIVKGWKESGELQLPRFDDDKIKEIEDCIVYPPEEASIH